MSTPMMSRTASSNSANAELMKASLRKDVQGHILREVDTKTFVTKVWGLPAATISIISESKLHTTPNVEPIVSAYNMSLLSRKDREPALHSPFRRLATTLVTSICQILGLDLDQAITMEFWDTKGNGELSSNLFFMHDRKRKHDMLDMFKQADGYKPMWDDVRCSFEFKKKDARIAALGSIIAESLDDVVRRLFPSSGASSSSGVVSSHSESLSSSKERTASGGTARSGSKRPRSEISDAQATSINQSHKKRRRIAVNGDDVELFTYYVKSCAESVVRSRMSGYRKPPLHHRFLD